jgi:hypothetical protein
LILLRIRPTRSSWRDLARLWPLSLYHGSACRIAKLQHPTDLPSKKPSQDRTVPTHRGPLRRRQSGVEAKRSAAFAAFLADELLEEVPHQMWVFTIPKMLRVYFLHHRELLGELSRVAFETVKELMAEAAFEDASFRPGMVSVVQPFGEAARFHPHVRGMCKRRGWDGRGEWVAVPFIDTQKAEELFRHGVLGLLKDKGLLSQERIKVLLSWRKSGFGVDNSVRIPAGERKSLEACRAEALAKAGCCPLHVTCSGELVPNAMDSRRQGAVLCRQQLSKGLQRLNSGSSTYRCLGVCSTDYHADPTAQKTFTFLLWSLCQRRERPPSHPSTEKRRCR